MEKEQTAQNTFLQSLKCEWKLLWQERFDDKSRAEGVAARDYPLVFMDRGHVIFATRGAKAPCFSEIIDYWRAQGQLYWVEPTVGGWGKFIRTELKKQAHARARPSPPCEPKGKPQLKKGGRGWRHR